MSEGIAKSEKTRHVNQYSDDTKQTTKKLKKGVKRQREYIPRIPIGEVRKTRCHHNDVGESGGNAVWAVHAIQNTLYGTEDKNTGTLEREREREREREKEETDRQRTEDEDFLTYP